MEELFKDHIVYYIVVLLAFVLGQATMFAVEVISYKRAKVENNINKIDFNKIEIQNKVHFYITADKHECPAQFKLWLGKPNRDRFAERWLLSNKTNALLAQTEEELEHYGLKPSDYNFIKWKSGAIEVSLNLKE